MPVRAKYADHDQTWDALCLFWPHRRPADVTVHGQEHRNILPLTHTAHALFDAFYFALRPVAHPQTPSTRIFLQVVYLRDPDGQRIATHWDHRRFGGLCDFRRSPHPKTSQSSPQEPCPASARARARLLRPAARGRLRACHRRSRFPPTAKRAASASPVRLTPDHERHTGRGWPERYFPRNAAA